ncbi:MAG: hypothetical protein J6Z01_03570 [Bacteroidales bacterium]|nr:hypothetical protein [Bacteroidales bacterium]
MSHTSTNTFQLPSVSKEETFTPYTLDELYQMVADGEKQIAEGRCYSTEEVIRMCDGADITETI